MQIKSPNMTILYLSELQKFRTCMIPPKLKDIFSSVPELYDHKKLEDWWNTFGQIDFDTLLKNRSFDMDINKVIRKVEFKGLH